MNPPRTILLAHHGTPGARLAEARAFAFAEAGATRIVHLFVVPDFWQDMQGDDWLNNASTRDAFAGYVQNMLEKEAAEQIESLASRCHERGLDYTAERVFGDPTACLLAATARHSADLVVIGPPRRKGEQGMRCRMDLEKLVRGLAAPLLVAARD